MPNPFIELTRGCYAVRGHEAYNPVTRRIEIVAAQDGPLIALMGPFGYQASLTIETARRFAEVLPGMLEGPVVAPGGNDAEIRAVGLEPIPVG